MKLKAGQVVKVIDFRPTMLCEVGDIGIVNSEHDDALGPMILVRPLWQAYDRVQKEQIKMFHFHESELEVIYDSVEGLTKLEKVIYNVES